MPASIWRVGTTLCEPQDAALARSSAVDERPQAHTPILKAPPAWMPAERWSRRATIEPQDAASARRSADPSPSFPCATAVSAVRTSREETRLTEPWHKI